MGAAVGGILLGTLTAGVGAGVGVAAGGAVGVGVGLLCSHAVTKMLERRKTKRIIMIVSSTSVVFVLVCNKILFGLVSWTIHIFQVYAVCA